MPTSEKVLAQKHEYYMANRETLLPRLRERRNEYYWNNRDVERARNLARYYYKKGDLDSAKAILAEAGLEFPARWGGSPAAS